MQKVDEALLDVISARFDELGNDDIIEIACLLSIVARNPSTLRPLLKILRCHVTRCQQNAEPRSGHGYPFR